MIMTSRLMFKVKVQIFHFEISQNKIFEIFILNIIILKKKTRFRASATYQISGKILCVPLLPQGQRSYIKHLWGKPISLTFEKLLQMKKLKKYFFSNKRNLWSKIKVKTQTCYFTISFKTNQPHLFVLVQICKLFFRCFYEFNVKCQDQMLKLLVELILLRFKQ